MAQVPFTEVTGYQDPYAELRKTHAAEVAARERAEANPAPMYPPEEIARRRAEFARMLQQGQVGALSNDKSVEGVSEPLLKRAMEAMKPTYREHGIFDEPSGQFTYFPGYQEARKTEAARRQQDLTENRSAAARSSYDLMKGRMHELAAIKAMNSGNDDKGSITHAGADLNGKAIWLHSKRGPFQYDSAGKPVAFLGPITPKLTDMPSAIQSKLLDNRASLSMVDETISALAANPGAAGGVAFLPNALSQYVPGKTGAEGVNVRARISDLGSLKIHDRTGAAMTAIEAERLKPFIPDVRWDSPKTIATKLEGFRRNYQILIAEAEAGYPLSRIRSQRHVPGGAGAAPAVPGQSVAGAIRGPGVAKPPVPGISPQRAAELEAKYGIGPNAP